MQCYCIPDSLPAALEAQSPDSIAAIVANSAYSERTEEFARSGAGQRLRSHRVLAAVEEGHHCAAEARMDLRVGSLEDTIMRLSAQSGICGLLSPLHTCEPCV